LLNCLIPLFRKVVVIVKYSSAVMCFIFVYTQVTLDRWNQSLSENFTSKALVARRRPAESGGDLRHRKE
jgi:hypothetical protein